MQHVTQPWFIPPGSDSRKSRFSPRLSKDFHPEATSAYGVGVAGLGRCARVLFFVVILRAFVAIDKPQLTGIGLS